MSKKQDSCRLMLVDEDQSFEERSNISALLVEDSDAFVEASERTLREAGYSVAHVSDCATALARVMASPVQILILDMRKKSESDARKLFRHLKSTWKNFQAFFISSDGSLAKVFHMTKDGVFECRGSQCNLGEAMALIREQCERPQA